MTETFPQNCLTKRKMYIPNSGGIFLKETTTAISDAAWSLLHQPSQNISWKPIRFRVIRL